MEHDFGVSQYKIHWYMERSEEMSHGGATGFKPPAGISFNRIAAEQEPSLDSARKRIGCRPCRQPLGAASQCAGPLEPYRRQRRLEQDQSRCFPIAWPKARAFIKQHGFLPVNHTYIIRGDIYRKYPWVAFNLYNGFVKAKALAREKLLERFPRRCSSAPEYLTMTRDMIGDDPFPYGIKANEAMLDTITAYSHEQGLTPKKMNVEELIRREHPRFDLNRCSQSAEPLTTCWQNKMPRLNSEFYLQLSTSGSNR